MNLLGSVVSLACFRARIVSSPQIPPIGSGVMKSACTVRCCALLLWSMSSIAQEHPTCAGPLLGTWVLLSMETEDLETSQKHNLLGVHPSGSLSYGPDCRMSAVLVKESRHGPAALV